MNPDVQRFFDIEADVTDDDDGDGTDNETENEMMLRAFTILMPSFVVHADFHHRVFR